MMRYTLPGWLKCDQVCTDDSMYNVFTSADLEPGQLQNAVATVESYLYTSSQLNFDRQVNKSYLPEMIRLTKEHGIQLVLVRLKQQTFGRSNSDTAETRRYIDKLSEYLDEQGVLFLDYGNDPRLINEGYKDPLHLNEMGQTIFTEILADGLNKTLK